ncbi:outer membrane beta-barrel protein [Pseudoalteromonas denitrificans]|uniref:Outer membrane protein beta-barrel domain-containing protein n=1 Tax=Pseudoalteromonas denitrificans DSM 6059 TaxID=1123010 RepID=A0A1I1L757_9GAMM|nr:outer membrane beta-barrel protein [Pseudoalteromonas denitrificans]SFC68914.1 Outer membrane protein beta-barrel domain-containing protein [Pseudoalteromonas denitrificans DSM 6059]
MQKTILSTLVAGLLISFTPYSNAKIIIGGAVGQSFSQRLETIESQKIEIKDDTHFNLTIEKSITDAKYGLFYSKMSTQLKNQQDKKLDFNYLLFQSAIDFPVAKNVSGYFGAQLGINKIKPNWQDSDTYFAAGLYGGVEYHLTQATRVLFETRWLSTIVDNNSKTTCDVANKTTDTNCLWHLDGDLLNQFQTSVGVSYRF